jgi:glutathione synthase/RimK-type ligase-like ATP-grasp enzyme
MTDSPDALYARAQSFARRGEDDTAKSAFLAVLAVEPSHFGALTDLAGLALATGYRSAALTAYRQAVACHPQNPKGLVNLANVLLENSELTEAKNLYEAALAADPAHAHAHQGLANVLAKLGDESGAQRHRDLGFRDHNIVVRPYRGTRTPLRVLLSVSVRGGNIPTGIILDDRIFEVTALYSEYRNPRTPLPAHDIVFNAIGDADLCGDILETAEQVVRQSSKPAINPPALIRDTGRLANANRLSGLADIAVPRMALLSRAALEQSGGSAVIAERGLNYPLLLRIPGFHTGQHFLRVETAEELPAAIEQLPGADILAIEYLDARGGDGLARKYRVLFIDGKLYPLHLAISSAWKVHYFTSDMAKNADHRREEERFLTDMPGVLGARAVKGLEALRDALGLDYGGVDFALAADGRLLLFEANATMAIVPPPQDAMWGYRRGPIENTIKAAQAMLGDRANQPIEPR